MHQTSAAGIHETRDQSNDITTQCHENCALSTEEYASYRTGFRIQISRNRRDRARSDGTAGKKMFVDTSSVAFVAPCRAFERAKHMSWPGLKRFRSEYHRVTTWVVLWSMTVSSHIIESAEIAASIARVHRTHNACVAPAPRQQLLFPCTPVAPLTCYCASRQVRRQCRPEKRRNVRLAGAVTLQRAGHRCSGGRRRHAALEHAAKTPSKQLAQTPDGARVYTRGLTVEVYFP
jgi:hypothetical protein